MKKILLYISIFLLLSCTGNIQQATLLFVQGKAQEERGALDSAIITYKEAIKQSEQAELRGSIYNRIGDLYLNNNLETDAFQAFETALKYNSTLADKSKASYSLRGMGKSHAYKLKPDSALHYSLLAYQLIPQIKDTNEIVSIYNNLANRYASLSQYEKANKFLEMTMNLLRDSVGIYKCYSIKAKIFNASHNYDSAQIYLKKGIRSSNLYTKAGCYLQLAELAKQTGDSNYINYLEMAKLLNDSIDNSKNTNNIVHTEKYSMESTFFQKQRSWILWIIFILMASLFFISLLFYHHKHRISIEKKTAQKINKQLQDREETVNKLQSEFILLKNEFNQIKEKQKPQQEQLKIQKQLQNTLDIILTRIKENERSCTNKFLKSKIYPTIKRELQDTNSVLHQKQQDEYRTTIQKAFNPYIQYLSIFTTMSSEDHYLCCLLLLKFSTKECAYLRGLTDDAIRSQRIRIRTKILASFGSKTNFEYIFP